MPDLIVPAAGQTVKTAVLDADGVSSILYGAASTTAMIYHMGTVSKSPGALLKAAEWYSYAMNLSWPVAAYRKLNYGTIDTGSFDITQMTSDQQAAHRTRNELYGQMCRNFFTFATRGPSFAKQYLEGLVTGTEGQQTALQQHFAAIRRVNNEITDSIDLLRRRVYVTRVACEVAMVVLGAAPIALGVQIGVGLGYSILTNAITHWAGMEQADIVAMPVKTTLSNTSAVGLNVAQEVVDQRAALMQTFEAARQRALGQQQGLIEQRIGTIIARAGGEDAMNRAASRQVERAGTRWAAIAETRAAAQAGTNAATRGMRVGVRGAGIAVGLYFMKNDLENVLTMVREGQL
jgi:hypothetical protein